MNLTQNEMILELLEDEVGLTALEALEHANCFRLAARVRDLKDLGHDICKHWINYTTTFGVDKSIACYWLVK